ncbi:MAG: TrmH family RNA methyltransferase [Solirubrobacteraceae bacterium]
MTIRSAHNEKLKEIRKLRARRRARDRVHRFVAEGEDLLAAADEAGWPAVERFCAEGSGLPGVEVDGALLASASGLASGTRALGVYEERWSPAPAGPVCVYLHGVADPGNVGAVLRSAQAFGASCVALGPGSADPFSPKAVRASMGAIFHVPVARAAPEQLPGSTIALDARAERSLAEVVEGLPEVVDGLAEVVEGLAEVVEGLAEASLAGLALLVGAERDGLPDSVVSAADHTARIPIATHSLNVAMAATVALYELSRARRMSPA